MTSLRHRTAWLLGVSRIHSTDPDLARRDRFIQQLQARGIVVDSTRLSRWETGHLPVASTVIAAYEQVLDLAPGQLTLGATALIPTSDMPPPGRGHVEHDTHAVHERLDALFIQVLAGRAPGHLWIELAELLTRHHHLYLLPATWAQTADLLAQELGRSTGLAYLSRFKSLRLLVAHPDSRRAAVRAIGSIVTNPATEFVTHPLVLLQEVDDPQANDLLLRLLSDSPSHRRAGASWALTGKLQRGQLNEVELDRVTTTATEILRCSRSMLQSIDALNIYLQLPLLHQARLMRSISDTETRAALEMASTQAEISHPETARSVSARMATTVQERTHTPHAVDPDPMLQRLIREAFFHVCHARRHQAALLLAASPYRGQLGAPLLLHAGNADELMAVAAMTTMTYVADEAHRASLLERGLTDHRLPVRVAALMALSQVVGSVSPVEAHRLRLAMPSNGPLRTATMHVLGIGAATLLPGIDGGEGPVAQAPRWWGGSGAIAEPMVRS
ncbi:hypothetical protein [Nocardioides sp.]|uniref:hypothetical protein n=1 Tax=Nocardioides sp. TaxID=35761 RepID=UPI00286A427B|nr:hypothetical protein [Nocardioides sp.]